ncbi:MAG: chemotaxis protein CheW [Desulfovibrionales bacterium]
MEKNGTQTGQYLSFVLADELYALDIGKVREVLELQGVTRVPRMPSYMRGIINLRGNAVPVVDLKEKFGLGRTEKTVDTCIIIVEVGVGTDNLVIGALADSVREVFELGEENMVPPPRMGTGIDTAFLHGMGKLDDRFIMLLNVEKIFSENELGAFGEIPDRELYGDQRQIGTAV